MKKGILALATLCFATFGLFGLGNVRVASAEEASKKSIDIYIIGGQSNAAGYSSNGSSFPEKFKNVSYAGEINLSRNDNSYAQRILEYPFRGFIGEGFGRTANYIGPEFGMAEVLNEYYEGDEANAIIVKSAAGGTALRNISSGETGTFGNWYPRSLWAGASVNPATSAMGVQYYNLVENVQSVYTQLSENGYEPHIRGMIWMQGEADLGYDNVYKDLLKTFITDIRADFKTITSDDSLDNMPFVIGEIATTFSTYNNEQVPAIVEEQRAVASEMEGVYTVKTDDLVIVDQNDEIVGTDRYHFNKQDARKLGNRFGDELIAATTLGNASFTCTQGGSMKRLYNANATQATLTLTPDLGYEFVSLKINDVDVTAQVQDGRYTLTDIVADTEVVAEFKLKALGITYRFDENMGSVQGVTTIERGEDLSVTVTPKEGYEVVSVKLGGRNLSYQSDIGKYGIDVVLSGGEVEVVFRKIVQVEDKKSDGNVGLIVGLSCGGAALAAGAAVVTVLFVKKRKKKQS